MNSRYTIKDKLVITILLIIIISCIILLVNNINLDFTTFFISTAAKKVKNKKFW